MLRAYREDPGVDVVHTRRAEREGESRGKLALTRLAYLILHKITSVKIPVEVGDFKLISKRATGQLLRCRERNPFMRGLVCWIGYKQAFVTYKREARGAGETKFPVLSWKVMRNFFSSAMISFSGAPLQFASLLGLLSAFIGVGLMAHVLIEKIRGNNIPGWTAIMVAVAFVGSVQLFSMGMIGLYLHAIFQEIMGRPNYIVSSTYGFPDREEGPVDSPPAD